MRKQKQKTRKSAVKRFKVTKKGKVLHRMQNYRHLRTKKSKKAIRKFKHLKEITDRYKKKVLKMLGKK